MTMQQPTHIDGTPVEAAGEPMYIGGRAFITLVPIDEEDHRLWEWVEPTGELIPMRDKEGEPVF